MISAPVALPAAYPLPIDGETANPREVDFVDGTFQSKLESFEAEKLVIISLFYLPVLYHIFVPERTIR